MSFSLDIMVVNEDGTAIPNTANVSLIQMIGETIWKMGIMSSNGLEICSTGPNHAFRAYLENELGLSFNYKNDYLSVAGYVSEHGDPDSQTGEGHMGRKKLIAQSKPCHIDGAVHFDLANQGKALLSMIDLNIRLFRNDDAFCLNNYDLNTNYKIKIRSLRLNVDTWDLTPGMNIELENTLRTQMALYDQVRTEVKTFTIPAGMKSAPEHALFTGIVPQR
jgi:hypothetical protein